MNTNLKYLKPIFEIAEALTFAEIPFEFHNCYDGAQLRFPWSEGDVVCHSGSYGANTDYVESYQFPWDNGDVTMLTIEEAIEKISNYYCEIYP